VKIGPNEKDSADQSSGNTALKMINGLLVFTGEIAAPEKDWLKVVRDERGDQILRAGTGDATALR
jgi:hypothetical protein